MHFNTMGAATIKGRTVQTNCLTLVRTPTQSSGLQDVKRVNHDDSVRTPMYSVRTPEAAEDYSGSCRPVAQRPTT